MRFLTPEFYLQDFNALSTSREKWTFGPVNVGKLSERADRHITLCGQPVGALWFKEGTYWNCRDGFSEWI